MQHNILFLRHNRLSWKYSDYLALSFTELRSLGLNIGIYSIQEEMSLDCHLNIDKYTGCFTSTQKRTIETAHSLWFSHIENRKYLDEIYFDLAELMTEEEYRIWGWLPSVRIALWKSFFERKKWVESPESVMGRIQLLLTEVKDNAQNNSIMVTHGFFLQMIRCFLIKWIDFTKISYDEFLHLEIPPVGYLEHFQVVV